MRLHLRLGLFLGCLLIFIMSALAGILYWQVRVTFAERSAEEASRLAESATGQADARSKVLSDFLSGLAQDYQIGLLFREAAQSGPSQRRLIEVMNARMSSAGLRELTAISPDGVVLARGHRVADFGDPADTAAPGAVYLTSGSAILRLRLPVRLQGRGVGEVEGGLDLSDVLADMGRLFSGDVALLTAAESNLPRARPLTFDVVVTKPWRLADGSSLGTFVFSKSDAESRAVFGRLILRIAGIFVIAALAVALVVLWVPRSVTSPLRRLAAAAGEISRGRRKLDLPPPSRDEIGDLTEAFSKMASSLDESEQKRLAAERLGAWQDAARMLAHEIKNPLSPVKLTATTLARAARENDPALPQLAGRGSAVILDEIAHLEKLLSEFSAFARFPSPSPAPADLNAAVRRSIDGFRGKLEGVRWIERYDPDIPPVPIDAGMFAEVLQNLTRNAAESGARTVHLETSRENRHAVLVFADDGPGIPAARRGSLFSPYFTTKPGGTGLGLAVSRKIMIEHGGDLDLIDPSPFSDAPGAAFRMKLPFAETAAPVGGAR